MSDEVKRPECPMGCGRQKMGEKYLTCPRCWLRVPRVFKREMKARGYLTLGNARDILDDLAERWWRCDCGALEAKEKDATRACSTCRTIPKRRPVC